MPTEEEIQRWEAQSVFFVRAMRVIAEALSAEEPASSGWLCQKVGVSLEEWRDAGGQLIASAIFFCWEHNFSEWHAESMFARGSRGRVAPSAGGGRALMLKDDPRNEIESAEDLAAQMSEIFDGTSNWVEQIQPLIEADRAAVERRLLEQIERDGVAIRELHAEVSRRFTEQDMQDFAKFCINRFGPDVAEFGECVYVRPTLVDEYLASRETKGEGER